MHRRALSLLLVLVVSLVAIGPHAAAAAARTPLQISATPSHTASFVPGEIIVGLRSDAPLTAQSLRAPRAMLAQRFSGVPISAAVAVDDHSYRLTVPAQADIQALAQQIRRDPAVRFAEPNYRYTALRTPNDPLYPFQYVPDRINLPHAWDRTTGSHSLIVAVIDTGVNPDHPELQDKLVPGYNFIEGNDQPFDDTFHGTFVSGIIAAPGNNGIGLAGVCWQCRILPVRALSRQGGTAGTLAQGIRFAVDHGARIINMSLGGSSDSTLLHDAVNYALSRDVLVVTAAGNSGDTDNAPSYPALYPGVVAVGATDTSDHLAAFSTRNSSVALTAPGVNVAGTGNESDQLAYGAYSGTSFSSAIVSGVAALMLSVNPRLSADQVKQQLLATAQKPEAGTAADGVGAGRVDAGRAVDAVYPAAFAPVVDPKTAGTSFFAETGHTLRGEFKAYWSINGGLPIFGYPISEEFDEPTAEGTFRVQYFERQRFELHVDGAGHVTVLGGRLGDVLLLRSGRNWHRLPAGNASDPTCRFFAATGHALCGPFRTFWETHGLQMPGLSAEARSLALWGLPLTEPQEEINAVGDSVITQWFERARFELHTTSDGNDRVLFGLLGTEAAEPAAAGPAPIAAPHDFSRCGTLPPSNNAVVAPANCVLFGTTIELRLDGFQATEPLTVQPVDAQGKALKLPKTDAPAPVATGDGTVSLVFDTSVLTPGLWSLQFQGGLSKHTAVVVVRIIDG